MKHFKDTLLLLLATTLAMTWISCSKPQHGLTDEDIQQAIEQDIEIGKATVSHKENNTAAVSRTSPPPIGISYQYKVGNEGLVAMHRITSGNFSWTVTLENGLEQITHADGLRPCDIPGTQHIPLDKVKDYGYEVDIALEEEIIQSYTLTAYPIGKYDLGNGTDCTIKDGKLEVLKGKHYYELIIEYHQGKVVYGFFID